MERRLIKIAKELNVGTQTIVDHLNHNGFDVANIPTARITDEMYSVLLKEFQKSLNDKEKADQMIIVNRGLKVLGKIDIEKFMKPTNRNPNKTHYDTITSATFEQPVSVANKFIETIEEFEDRIDFFILCKEFNIDKTNLLNILANKGYKIENKPKIQITSKSYEELKGVLKEVIESDFFQKENQKPQIKIAIEKIKQAEQDKLKQLDLSNLGLDYLPNEIFRLSNLNELNLRGNNLNFLPFKFSSFSNLREIDLGKNIFTEVPDEAISLKSIESLNLSENTITEIPEKIIISKKLKKIDLSNNRIKKIPREIGFLSNLRELKLNNNEIEALSDEIRDLDKLEIFDISKNKLEAFPDNVINLPNLSEIYLYSNPIQNIPLEIYDKKGNRIRAMRDYYDSLESGKTNRLFEAKLIIIGNGNAGKTTLTKKLINTESVFNEGENTTEGIDIRNWNLPVEDMEIFKDITTKIKIKIWDFGGQEIYRSTHRFFLTKRSIYLFVWDARGNDTYEHFDYWLNIVQTLGGSSPLIMVMNKTDVREKEIDNESLQEKYPFIYDFGRVSCKTGRGINDLKESIKSIIGNLDHIGETWSKERLEIKSQLEGDKRYYISYDEFKSICRSKGLDFDQINLTSEYLHDLGTIIHFQENSILKHIVILKPDWATSAIYKVLDTPKIQEKSGEFSIDDLKEIWRDNEDYLDKYDQLLELMNKFELCFKLKYKEIYIAPELLPSKKPNYLKFNLKKTLNFEYHYEFMPSGVLNSFVHKNANLIEGKAYWKNGVVLNSRQGKSRAEIFTEPFEKNKRVIIRVEGKTRVDKINLLQVIRDSFDEIHEKYQRLSVKEMLPCICYKCIGNEKPYFYDFSLLEKCRLASRKEIYCPESIADVSVEDLLRGVTDTGQYKVFFSYSRKDKELRDRLDTHLKVLQKNELISTWYDNEILPGQDWSQEIASELNSADFILLLISADYFASEYCFQEMKVAVERHNRSEAVAIPIILKPCNWQSSPIAKLNVLPRKGDPIAKSDDLEAVLTEVSKELENLIIKQSGLSDK